MAPFRPFEMCEAHNGAPTPSIFASLADVINEVARASHRSGYLENAASSSSTGCNIISRSHLIAKQDNAFIS